MNILPLQKLAAWIVLTNLLAAAPLHAQSYVLQEVMHGLVTPRGLAIGPDGGLYVAEAGSGGDGPTVTLGNGRTVGLGFTGGLSRLLDGVQQRLLNGLPSVATDAGLDAGGLQDIVFDAAGDAYGLFSFGSTAADRDSRLGAAGAVLGSIVRLPLDGSPVTDILADVVLHENSTNPAGGAVDSNPFSLALAPSGEFVVADAGGNDVVRATAAGNVATLAVLPARPNPLPFGPPVFQSVPTAVAIGPDDAYYVGQLTGFPFPPGAAQVYRYDPAAAELAVAYTGFTNIIDLTFDAAGNLYVLQLTANGLAAATGPGSGQLLRIDAVTGDRTTLVAAGLDFPGSVVAAADGTLYVTNRTNAPFGGQVLRLVPTPEPTGLALSAASLSLLAVRRRRR